MRRHRQRQPISYDFFSHCVYAHMSVVTVYISIHLTLTPIVNFSIVHSLAFIHLLICSLASKQRTVTHTHNFDVYKHIQTMCDTRNVTFDWSQTTFFLSVCWCVLCLSFPMFNPNKSNDRHLYIPFNLCFDYRIIKFNELQWHFVELNFNYIGIYALISLTFIQNVKWDGK